MATPTAEKATSQAQQNFTAQQQQAFDAWKKLVDEQIARLGSFYEEFAKVESKGTEQARASIDEFAKVTKEALSYASQYSSEWRRVSLEAARRTAELLTPRA
jgi:hypothetical protein